MTDEDDSTDAADETADVSAEDLETRLDDAEEALEAAETEADLDEVAANLDDIESDLEAAELDGEDEENPAEAIAERTEEFRGRLEEQRGPYAEDVLEAIGEHQATIGDTRWTARGTPDVQDAVDAFVDAGGDALDTEFDSAESEEREALSHELDALAEAIEDAELDPDEDDETLTALVEATAELGTALEEAEEWDDLEINEQLRAEGFYDVLGHYKDFPVEWAALKEHEKQGNVEQVLRALDALDSDFMERHCLESLTRMGDAEAYDAMLERASKRDRPGITALGKMGEGAEEAVETLLEYVDTDSDPQLQKVTFRALGEIGSEEATQALANKLEMENDNVRPLAARALGLVGDTRAIEPLAETLAEDDDRTVRTAAAWALRQIGTRDALEAAAEYEDAHSYTLQAEAEKARGALETGDDEAAVEA
ncbi:MAG: HEAT repeat domain-containing protein [Halolamina sp.]